jgi:hypothetical protein
MAQSPSDISPNDDAAKIRVAALEAAKAVPGASLGEGDLNRVIDLARSSPQGSDERMTVAAGLATTIAKAQTERPLNYLSATPQEVERERAALGLPPLSGIRVQGRFSSPERDGDGRASGARYDGMNASGFTQIQLQARDFALSHGLEWATHNPDLLRLGPSAMQALADVQLRQDSFQRFKNAGLSNKTIVAGARYAKRNKIDYNEASKKIEETDRELSPEGRVTHRKAIEELFNCKPGEEEPAKKKFNKSMDEGLKHESPKAHEKIRDEQKALHAQKAKEQAAEKNAEAKEAKNEDTAAKGADLIKKRQAAAQGAKPST